MIKKTSLMFVNQHECLSKNSKVYLLCVNLLKCELFRSGGRVGGTIDQLIISKLLSMLAFWSVKSLNTWVPVLSQVFSFVCLCLFVIKRKFLAKFVFSEIFCVSLLESFNLCYGSCCTTHRHHPPHPPSTQ